MGDFSLEQVRILYQQHTTETGQIFEPAAIDYAFISLEEPSPREYTEGHLIIFDKRDKTWEEKIYTRQETVGNHSITVWGM
jgi:hypothetical protein